MLGERSDQRGLWEADRLYLDHAGRESFYGLLASMRGRVYQSLGLAYLDLSGNLVEQFDLHPEIVREIVPNEEGDGFTKGFYINVPECVPAAIQYHLYVNLHGVSYVEGDSIFNGLGERHRRAQLVAEWVQPLPTAKRYFGNVPDRPRLGDGRGDHHSLCSTPGLQREKLVQRTGAAHDRG